MIQIIHPGHSGHHLEHACKRIATHPNCRSSLLDGNLLSKVADTRTITTFSEQTARPRNRGVLLWKGNLIRKYLIHFVIPLSSLFLSGCTPASLMPSSLQLATPAILALLAIPVVIALRRSGKIPAVKDLLPDRRVSEENITHTFLAALPTLTREMNLEVTSSKQIHHQISQNENKSGNNQRENSEDNASQMPFSSAT